jgi:hypothetical protein
MSLKDYLTPTPAASDSLETWEDVLSKKYRIDTEDKLKKAHLVVDKHDQDNMSLEFKCLFIEIVRQTCLKKEDKLAQRIFKKPSIAHVLTETWISTSIAHIEVKEFTTNLKDNLHVVLLKTVMQFMVDCYVIKSPKMIATLKEKQNMDWEKTVKGVLRVATAKRINGLVSTAIKARDHIQRIMDTTAPPSTATKATSPLKASEAPEAPKADDAQAKELKKERDRQMRMEKRKADVAKLYSTTAPLSASAATTLAVSRLAVPTLDRKAAPFGGAAVPFADPGDWGTPDSDESRRFTIGEFLEKFAGIKQACPEDAWGGLQDQQERQPFETTKDPLLEGVWSTTSTENVNKKRPTGKNEKSVGSYGPSRGQSPANDVDAAKALAKALIPPDLGTKIAVPSVPPKHSDSSIGGYVVQRLSLSL